MKEFIESALLVALHETPGVGWKTISRIVERGISHDMLEFDDRDWGNMGLGVETAARLSVNLRASYDEKCQNLSSAAEGKPGGDWKTGIQVITRLEEGYPDMLKSSIQAPWVLYALGRTEWIHEPGVAVVGTRVPTAYGRKVGQALTEELCAAGMLVVSGMARGIDSVVHETALRCGGRTIAVLGAGIDVVYPPENLSLYEEMIRKGLILSEYPPGTKAHPGYFPQRNRIIAGLTLGTLVVEADIRSGSLITADAALEAGRDVFAVPGPITSPKSKGTLDLIKQGAKMVTCSQDILEEYALRLPIRTEQYAHHSGGAVLQQETTGLTNDETRIYHMLEQGALTLDELLNRTLWDFGHLHSVLLSLIIKKQISQLPGAIYKLI